jgi:serine/threonine protein kinase
MRIILIKWRAPKDVCISHRRVGEETGQLPQWPRAVASQRFRALLVPGYAAAMARRIAPDDKTRIGPDAAVLGGYTVVERIADDTMGNLFVARAPDGKTVLLRLFDLDGTAPDDAREAVRALRRLIGLTIPHVVPVLDVGGEERPFVVTPNVYGLDLATVIGKSGPLPLPRALRVLREAASGLEEAASKGVLHGDIRPGNLFLVDDATEIAGFAIASPWKTSLGRVVRGDAAYLAPEVSAGRRGDVRSDIYALGCTIYELLTGRPPFGAVSRDALVACHTHEAFPLARRRVPTLSVDVDNLLSEMGAKDPGKRPQSYEELQERAEDLLRRMVPQDVSPPLLIVESGRQQGLSVILPEGSLLLGRVPGEGFVVDDGRISRRHAVVHRRGGRVSVEDLGSRNGIKVNGTRVKDVALSPGDRIALGDTVLRVESCDPAVGREEVTGTGPHPSSPVRGAFGAKELVHAPARQRHATDLFTDPSSVLAAVTRLAVHLADGDFDAGELRRVAVDAARDATRAERGLVVDIGEFGPEMQAASADEAQVLSIVLPAVERAMPGQLALLTSVRADRMGAWSTVLAPLVDASGTTVSYLVVVRREQAFEPEDLAALEIVADLVSRRLARIGSPGEDAKRSRGTRS